MLSSASEQQPEAPARENAAKPQRLNPLGAPPKMARRLVDRARSKNSEVGDQRLSEARSQKLKVNRKARI
ncbi:MAG: hypothetical protein DMF60_22035 [Acidobacteria bacterium]|nr:MAG: hypothetical protein DMF60_22035 [Acidobacteriota bacterium]